MKIDAPANLNYAAQVVRIPAVITLKGLDNLVGIPVLGHQALTQKGKEVGELAIAFTAETQLSDEFAAQNNLYRHADKNVDPTEAGYLEDNRRIRALRLRGHVSNALLMPLESVEFTGHDPYSLQEGDTFDTLNGQPVCNKYELPKKADGTASTGGRVARAFKRVDTKMFPEHLSTDNYFRSAHLLDVARDVVLTQKLHGTSFRAGRVPVLRKKSWFERNIVNRLLRVPTATHEFDVVFGSRKVIKDPNNPAQNHFYATSGDDLWTGYGKSIADVIPEGYMVYGELVGWTPGGAPLQKNYTYHLLQNAAELYVYRVATVNAQGTMSDLSWDGVKEFCVARGLSTVPELARLLINPENTVRTVDEFTGWVTEIMDMRLRDHYDKEIASGGIPAGVEAPLALSDPKTVDEGICIRQEGLVPRILKAKSPVFLEHETKQLDKGEVDLETAA